MRAISFCATLLSFLVGTRALVISKPQFLTAGPARINFTKTDGDPVGAFFNIGVASNASRLADNVDLNAGFFDCEIIVLPGTYFIFAFGNDTDGGRSLGSTDDFPVIALPNSSPTTSSAPTSSSPSASPTSASQSSSGTVAPSSSSSALTSVAARRVSSQKRRLMLYANMPHTLKKTMTTGMIVGIVIAILAIIAILLFLFFFLRRRKQRTRRLPETGVMIETPGLMVRSSLSLTARNRSQVDPFVTPSSSDTSLPSPAQRQQYITNEMRLVRKRMEELRRTGDISTSGFSSSSASSVPQSSALSPLQTSTHDTSALDLERSRQENDALQSRIAELEEQLQSAWALGLSNEPPPGYVA